MILGINGIISVSRGDSDAQAFITAANITDTTQKNAVNQLVIDLKTANIWTKMKAIYPFVGGTATTHKFNLKDPRDLDAAYRLVFNGGWTHSSTGALPNGTNGYANTFFKPRIDLATDTNAHISKYNRTNDLSGNKVDGVYSNIGGTIYYLQQNYSSANGCIGDVNTIIPYTQTDARGFFTTTRTSSTSVKVFKNSTQQGSTNTTSNLYLPDLNVYIGARNDGGGAFVNFYNTYETAFFSLGNGLTDAEAANFYTAVQTFQTTLGRQVGVPIVADTDAQAFLNAAVITNQTQANAINTLVTSLKSANIWSKMKAIYPFVGGTASSHKFNLKDPRDLDVAFRLQFYGGGTHSANGYQPDGATAYADTKLNSYLNLSLNSTHISIYSRTDKDALMCDMGCGETNKELNIFSKYSATFYPRCNSISNAGVINYNTSLGLFISNRTTSTQIRAWRNNNISTLSDTSTGVPNLNIIIGALVGSSLVPYFYSDREQAFASIGDGLSDTEATALYNAVQTFQTTLGRQV